jgi:hypothetical protein
MADQTVLDRISGWEADGVIDAATAGRLREAEGTVVTAHPDVEAEAPTSSAAAAMFGPSVTIAEMFGYLGAIFLLAAWFATLARVAGTSATPETTYFLGGAIATAVVGAIGALLRTGSRRQQRAAGALFVVAVSTLFGTGTAAGSMVLGGTGSGALVVGGVAAVAAALAFRLVHPSLLTQFGVVGAIVGLSGALLAAGGDALFRSTGSGFSAPDSNAALRVVLSAAWWALTAVLLGLLGLRESWAPAGGADRRAALTRFAAGLTLVIGVSTALFASGPKPGTDFEYGRIVEPLIGIAVMLVIAAILIERAFHREAAAYVYPAGLAVIVALTDLNASYLSPRTSTDVGLFIEGIILLGAGFAFEQLRRRVGGAPVAVRDAQAEEVVEPAATG